MCCTTSALCIVLNEPLLEASVVPLITGLITNEPVNEQKTSRDGCCPPTCWQAVNVRPSNIALAVWPEQCSFAWAAQLCQKLAANTSVTRCLPCLFSLMSGSSCSSNSRKENRIAADPTSSGLGKFHFLYKATFCFKVHLSLTQMCRNISLI